MQQNQILDSKAVYVDEIGIPTAGWNLIQNEDEHEIAYWEPWAFDSDEEIYTPEFLPLPGSQVLFLECPIFEALYHGNRGPGKRLELSEPILTSRGWIEAQEVTLSDKLVAVDGTYTDVLAIYPGYDEDYYCITFNDGTQINACKDHLWSVYDQKNGPREGFKVRSSEWIFNSKSRIGVPYLTAAVAGSKWGGPDPYLVGLMLGDGTPGSRYPTLYSADEEIVRYAEKLGWSVYEYKIWRAVAVKNAISQPFRELFDGMGKAGDKYVPETLMVADPESRLACLQGLMDSDGSIEKIDNKCRFVSKSEKLAQCVAQLVRSLGGKATCYREDRISPKGGVDWRWRVNLNARDMFIPFRLKRKTDRVMPPPKRVPMVKYIDNIKPIGKRSGVCFTVAHSDHLFVARNYTITHNTITLIMDFAKEVGKGYGSSWRGILFRRHFKDLDDVVKKIEEFFYKMWPGFRFLKSKSEYMAIWPTGEALLLRHIEKKDDYDSYHGHEYPWIGWEELTQWADDKVFNLMQSCCRSSAPGIPCRVRSTTNPYGIGHNWVKKRYELPRSDGKVIRIPGQMPRVAIRGALRENFLLLQNQPHYETIIANAAKNPAQAKAWIKGDWDVTSGGMIDDLWNDKVHVIPNIPAGTIPHSWTITRAYDHGQSHPFSVGWWLQSSGEPITIDNRLIGNVRGDLILWMEWYGTTGEPNTGIRMRATKIAEGILDREEDENVLGRVLDGPADTEIYTNVATGTGRGPADDMEDAGVTWERADKSRGSRKRGWEKLRELIEQSLPGKDGTRDKPGLFICTKCKYWLDLVPVMPRDETDPDEIPSTYEDHICDMTRYRITWVLMGMFRKGF